MKMYVDMFLMDRVIIKEMSSIKTYGISIKVLKCSVRNSFCSFRNNIGTCVRTYLQIKVLYSLRICTT